MFVCTGNTCRSPMAEALAKKVIAEASLDIDILSRGISVYFSSEASKHAQEVMKEYSIDLTSHRSKQIEEKDLENTDIILTMTYGHKKHITLNFPKYKEKIFTLKEFVEDFGDVEDPFGGELEEYKSCAEALYILVNKAIKKMSSDV